MFFPCAVFDSCSLFQHVISVSIEQPTGEYDWQHCAKTKMLFIFMHISVDMVSVSSWLKRKLHFDANCRHNLCVCVLCEAGRQLNYLRMNCRTQQSGEIEGVSLLPSRQLSNAEGVFIRLLWKHKHTHTEACMSHVSTRFAFQQE